MDTEGLNSWRVVHYGHSFRHERAGRRGFFETRWDITVATAPAQPQYHISFSMETQYDQPVKLQDVWAELNAHFTRLTMAVMSTK